jgi:hypothetical protein
VAVAFGAEVGDTTLLDGVFDLADCVLTVPDLPELPLAGVADGVAWGVTGGGWMAAGLTWVPALATARVAGEASSRGARR